jgi:hypothetical protein
MVDWSNIAHQAQKGRRGNTQVPPEDIEKYTRFYDARLAAYGYDDAEPKNREALARYCAKYFSGCMPKGLALIGDTGRGKTFGLRLMAKLFGWRWYDACDLVDTWQKLGVKNRADLWKDLKGYNCSTSWRDGYEHCWKDIVIDDMGTEPTLNEYGTKLEVSEQIINKRVKEYEQNQAFTFMTLNLVQTDEPLTERSIQGRYGKRFLSRLNQICYVVQLKGTDRRIGDNK